MERDGRTDSQIPGLCAGLSSTHLPGKKDRLCHRKLGFLTLGLGGVFETFGKWESEVLVSWSR